MLNGFGQPVLLAADALGLAAKVGIVGLPSSLLGQLPGATVDASAVP